jgi:hypothetical protein
MKTVINFSKAIYEIVYNNLGLLLLIQLAAAFVLLVPSQAHELVDIYFGNKTDNKTQWYNVIVLLSAVLLWSIINYVIVYLNLYVASNSSTNDYNRKITKAMPTVFAALPVVITMIAFGGNFFYLALNCILLICYRLFFRERFANYNDKLIINRHKGKSWRSDYTFLKNNKVLKNILFVYLASLFILIFALVTSNNQVMQHLGTPAIAVLGFAFITLTLGIAAFFNDSASRPVLLLLFFYFLVCSALNDNSLIRTIDSPEPTKIALETHFTDWVKHRTDTTDTASTLPVYFIASEGGGIRAMVWTAYIMQELSKKSTLKNNIYALSGVSGGGTGLAYYFARQHDKSLTNTCLSDSCQDVFLKKDFLSDVTGGLFFSDGFQSYLPFGVSALDRTKKLEDAFASNYKRVFLANDSANIYDKPFTKLWYNNNGSYNYDLPSLLINSTLAETGQRAITSNLNLQMDSLNIVNVIAATGRDMPFKTANILMARFPFITKGGLIKHKNGSKMGHLTDGGYFENTGIESLLHLYYQLKPTIEQIKKNSNVTIEPHIIFIQNSTIKSGDSTVKAATFFYGITTIFQSFYQPWNNGTQTRNNMYQNLLKQQIKYTRISLDDPSMPLGWYLSPKTVDILKFTAKERVQNVRF